MKETWGKKLKLKKDRPVAEYIILSDCKGCFYPNNYDEMIGCEFGECNNWYHKSCAGTIPILRDSFAWFCPKHVHIKWYIKYLRSNSID